VTKGYALSNRWPDCVQCQKKYQWQEKTPEMPGKYGLSLILQKTKCKMRHCPIGLKNIGLFILDVTSTSNLLKP
jgi:hypothetical protein